MLSSLYLKVFDVCLLVPALAVLFLLFYTSPRCRQKLSGCPLVVLALHLATWATTVILLLRALLTIGTQALCLVPIFSINSDLKSITLNHEWHFYLTNCVNCRS